MQFEKWHGLGNDFIVVQQAVSPELVRKLCDRRRGIGADGVVALRMLSDASVRMVIVNADGSRPEMCGNGLRCAAGFVAERGGWSDGLLLVRTDAGDRRCDLVRRSETTFDVGVAMGATRVGERFRFRPDAPGPHGDGLAFVDVDVGNPHAVTFDAIDDLDIARLGSEVERAAPGGRNVELCRIFEPGLPGHPDAGRLIEVAVWERGVGLTPACGTGACAVVAAAVAQGLVPASGDVRVRLPGGELVVRVDADGQAHMRGPAERVFSGTFAEPIVHLAGDDDGFF